MAIDGSLDRRLRLAVLRYVEDGVNNAIGATLARGKRVSSIGSAGAHKATKGGLILHEMPGPNFMRRCDKQAVGFGAGQLCLKLVTLRFWCWHVVDRPPRIRVF